MRSSDFLKANVKRCSRMLPALLPGGVMTFVGKQASLLGSYDVAVEAHRQAANMGQGDTRP